MKTWNLLKLLQSGNLSLIANLASISGVLYVIFTNQTNSIIGLVLLLIFLLIVLIKFFTVIDLHVSKKTLEGHIKLANYIRYSTTDGRQISWETHRYIQSKRLITDEFEYLFFWTGSTPPKIHSTQQIYDRTIKSSKDGEFDKAIFKFKEPLIYN